MLNLTQPRLPLSLLALSALFTSACFVHVLSGPTRVHTGDVASYVVEVGSFWGPGRDFVLSADVPTGWTLLDSTFQGTLQGQPVSGQGQVLDEPGVCGHGTLRPGFQRIELTGGPLAEAEESDTALVTLRFEIESQPEGKYRIGFRFGGWNGNSGDCSSMAVRTINRTGGPLTFVQALFDDDDGIDGLFGASGLDVSPQGDLLVVAGTHDDLISIFGRSEDGTLSFLGTAPGAESAPFSKGVIRSLDDVVFGPGGQYAYSMRRQDEQLAAYSREADTLTLEQILTTADVPDLEDLVDFEVTDHYAYALADGLDQLGFDGKRILVFSRDSETGLLALIDSAPATEFAFTYGSARDLALSPDGSQIYVSIVDPTSGFLSVLARDLDTGLPVHQQTVSIESGAPSSVADIRHIAPSPEGQFLVTASVEVVSIYRRNAASKVSWLADFPLEALGFGPLPVSRLEIGENHQFWAAGEGWIAAFTYDLEGQISLLDIEFAGDPPNLGITGAVDLARSPDGANLYSADLHSRAVGVFKTGVTVFQDGFESGDLGAWNVQVP